MEDVASAADGAGTVVEGIVSNLITAVVAEASAAFWSSSRSTVLSSYVNRRTEK